MPCSSSTGVCVGCGRRLVPVSVPALLEGVASREHEAGLCRALSQEAVANRYSLWNMGPQWFLCWCLWDLQMLYILTAGFIAGLPRHLLQPGHCGAPGLALCLAAGTGCMLLLKAGQCLREACLVTTHRMARGKGRGTVGGLTWDCPGVAERQRLRGAGKALSGTVGTAGSAWRRAESSGLPCPGLSSSYLSLLSLSLLRTLDAHRGLSRPKAQGQAGGRHRERSGRKEKPGRPALPTSPATLQAVP